MFRFNKSLSLFMAGLALTGTKVQAAPDWDEDPYDGKLDPISLRPLNAPGDNVYAAHRSHSSHSSHRSSSGSYSAPRQPSSGSSRRSDTTPRQPSSGLYGRSDTAPRQPTTSLYNRYGVEVGKSQPVDPGRPATVTRIQSDIDPNDQALKNLVTRVQIALLSKGYDPGTIDGVFGTKTKNALMHFQVDQGLEIDGLMGTTTLNALGVVAR